MGLFQKKQNYLGIDFGENEIKIVELKKEKQGPVLNTYGFLNRGVGVLGEAETSSQEIAKELRKLLEKAKVTTRTTISSLPSFSVFTAIISLPQMSEKELNSSIVWEAEKYIPGSINDVILYWEVLKKKEIPFLKFSEENTMEILLTAAPKKIINKYVEILKLSNLVPLSLETEAFASIRALVGKDKERTMIIDLGGKGTDICIVEGGIPLISRTAKIGGDNMTQLIAKVLAIEEEKADQFKKDFILDFSKKETIPEVLKPLIDDILEEIKHSLNLFYSQGGEKIEKIILAGGSSQFAGLLNYFKEKLGIEKIFIGNPWAKIAYSKELEPLLFKIGPGFSVACGLALKEVI